MTTGLKTKIDGSPYIDLKKNLNKEFKSCNNKEIENVAQSVLDELVDDIALSICFDIHRSVKTGVFNLIEVPEKATGHSTTSSNSPAAVDVFGQYISTSVGVPVLKKQPECVCPNCQRNMAASRFAPHLEKCMGMGRNSSRLASRRLATNSKDSYRETGGNDDEDDEQDEDWIEPGSSRSSSVGPSGSGSHSGGLGLGSKRRQRDKNSPRRTHKGKHHGSRGTSGETTPLEGSVTPPSSFDQLSIEERSQWLSTICGVASTTNRKICTRSTRCPIHTDTQRREVRIRWLSPGAPGLEGSEETHVDIDSFTEGDTAALRESLAQLSNASSPAESTISTSSNLSAAGERNNSRGGRSREKNTRRGKKGRPGSKGGSRGSTPPMILD